jgi:hypothetical protein
VVITIPIPTSGVQTSVIVTVIVTVVSAMPVIAASQHHLKIAQGGIAVVSLVSVKAFSNPKQNFSLFRTYATTKVALPAQVQARQRRVFASLYLASAYLPSCSSFSSS